PANPGSLYRGEFPSSADTQERVVGGVPPRFNGHTTRGGAARTGPARPYIPVCVGRVRHLLVAVFYRDTESQHACPGEFFVWTRRAGTREADALSVPTLASDTTMAPGTNRNGYVYHYVGKIRGPWFVVYDPDFHVSGHASQARGVWLVNASG